MAGDMFFTRESLYKLRKFPFRKILIIGNHCTDHEPDIRDLVECFDDIHESKKRGKFLITHSPRHPAALRGRFNVHAHMHETIIRDPRYINISLEATGFRLVDFEEIRTGEYRTYIEEQK
jgi:calcineurin-like phosphoesterase family protein